MLFFNFSKLFIITFPTRTNKAFYYYFFTFISVIISFIVYLPILLNNHIFSQNRSYENWQRSKVL